MERKRFAWWPVQVTSGQRTWLNTFYEHKNMYDATTAAPAVEQHVFCLDRN